MALPTDNEKVGLPFLSAPHLYILKETFFQGQEEEEQEEQEEQKEEQKEEIDAGLEKADSPPTQVAPVVKVYFVTSVICTLCRELSVG